MSSSVSSKSKTQGPFLTVAEVAARLQVTRSQIYKLLARGKLQALRIGDWRFNKEYVESLLKHRARKKREQLDGGQGGQRAGRHG